MADGLKIWNSSGVLVFDVTTRITRLLGSLQTGNQNGSITVENSGNQIFFFIISNDPSQATRGIPVIGVSGNVLSWTFVENIRTPCTLYYGLW